LHLVGFFLYERDVNYALSNYCTTDCIIVRPTVLFAAARCAVHILKTHKLPQVFLASYITDLEDYLILHLNFSTPCK